MGGDQLPFLSLEMPLCISEWKKKKEFGFSALLVCHTKAAFGGTADCAPSMPRAPLVQPFPLSLLAGTLKAAQRRSSGYPEGAKECQNN